MFTATDDLRSAFPATAARQVGLDDVPLLCARELDVEGAMPRVVPLLLHFHSDRPADDVVHVYLDGAAASAKVVAETAWGRVPIAVIGTGLMGTSIALAARKAGAPDVRGWDRDGAALDEASRREAVTSAPSLEAAVRGAAVAFVGGHPLTGSERSGPEGASATLLDGTVWVSAHRTRLGGRSWWPWRGSSARSAGGPSEWTRSGTTVWWRSPATYRSSPRAR